MQKSKLNFIIDFILFIILINLAATGALIHFVLPHGSRHITLWGMNRHDWGEVHFWLAVSMIILMLVHIILHWGWIVSLFRGRDAEKSKLRAGVLLAILGFFVVIAVLPFFWQLEEGDDIPRRQREADEQNAESLEIRRSTTLHSIETMTGISADTILQELGIFDDYPLDTHLGRLINRHGFSLEDVESIILRHSAKD